MLPTSNILRLLSALLLIVTVGCERTPPEEVTTCEGFEPSGTTPDLACEDDTNDCHEHWQGMQRLAVGDRLVARVTRQSAAEMPLPDPDPDPIWPPPLEEASMLWFVWGSLLLTLIGGAYRSIRHRRPSFFIATLCIVPLLAHGCSWIGSTRRASWLPSETVYLHQGFGVGPTIVTRSDGTIVEERRAEPFGTAIDSFREPGGVVSGANYSAEPYNSLNKPTDPATNLSYHGARWTAPRAGRWLSPDPPVKGPDTEFVVAPWAVHPYQYADQNPVLYWDPDGRVPDPPNRQASARTRAAFREIDDEGRPITEVVEASRTLSLRRIQDYAKTQKNRLFIWSEHPGSSLLGDCGEANVIGRIRRDYVLATVNPQPGLLGGYYPDFEATLFGGQVGNVRIHVLMAATIGEGNRTPRTLDLGVRTVIATSEVTISGRYELVKERATRVATWAVMFHLSNALQILGGPRRTAVLELDRGAFYHGLTPQQQGEIIDIVTRPGGYIQLQRHLTTESILDTLRIIKRL